MIVWNIHLWVLFSSEEKKYRSRKAHPQSPGGGEKSQELEETVLRNYSLIIQTLVWVSRCPQNVSQTHGNLLRTCGELSGVAYTQGQPQSHRETMNSRGSPGTFGSQLVMTLDKSDQVEFITCHSLHSWTQQQCLRRRNECSWCEVYSLLKQHKLLDIWSII